MNYKIERLKKLNEFLIPEAFKDAKEHSGEELYYRRVVDLCKERDALNKKGLKGLLSKIRYLDRFAIALPLSLTLLTGCMTESNFKDFKDGYYRLFVDSRQKRKAEDFPLNPTIIPDAEGKYKASGEEREICKPQTLCFADTFYSRQDKNSYVGQGNKPTPHDDIANRLEDYKTADTFYGQSSGEHGNYKTPVPLQPCAELGLRTDIFYSLSSVKAAHKPHKLIVGKFDSSESDYINTNILQYNYDNIEVER